MSLFGKVKRIINESNHTKILLEKDSDAFKQYKKSQKSFDKTFGKNIKPTVFQRSLDLYGAGGPYVPNETTFLNKQKVPKMEPKPQFGKPKPVTKTGGAPDKTLLKKAISDVKDSERRLFKKGLGKGTAGIKGVEGKKGISLVRQRKYTKEIIKDLSAKTTQSDARVRGGSTEGTAGASGSSKTTKPKVTPTKVVKQSEVSKKAQDFTKNINQKRQTTTPSKSDVERIKQNKIDTKKADAFKKTAAYKNIAQGKDSKGNYLSKEQRKANFIKQTKQNKATKNKTVKHNKNFGTSKTVTGKNKVTTGMGAGAQQKVTYNKDFIKDIKNPPKVNRPANYGTASYYRSQGKDAFDLRKNPLPQGKPGTRTGEPVLPKFSKKSGVTNPSFMKKIMPKMKKAATPAAKAFMKAGPVGKIAGAALVLGGAVVGANQIRKAFAGAGKPKAPPAVKGSALRYTSGPKKGQKKYFDIKTMKKKYFTGSDFRDSKGNIDSGFNTASDKKLQQKLRSTK